MQKAVTSARIGGWARNSAREGLHVVATGRTPASLDAAGNILDGRSSFKSGHTGRVW